MHVTLLLLCANILTLAAQTSRKQFDTNVKGIREYDLAAIAKVGDSGNPAYIPYLREILIHTPMYRDDDEEEALIALMKLGDKRRMRDLECSLLTVEPSTVNHLAGHVLPKVRGWFAVRQFFFLLDQDGIYLKNLEHPEYNSDVIFVATYPSHWAVMYLPKIIPRSPFPAIKDPEDPRIPTLATQWKAWIRRNRVWLERMRPHGTKGLTFANTGCPAEPQW